MAPPAVAKLIHLALCSGLLLATGVVWLATQQAPPTEFPVLVLYLPLVVGAGSFGGALVLRSRLLDGGSDNSADWWRANLQRAILLWALFEGPALFGAVLFATSHQWIPLIATAIGFVLLALHSPALLRPE
jgi:hypothetical protein